MKRLIIIFLVVGSFISGYAEDYQFNIRNINLVTANEEEISETVVGYPFRNMFDNDPATAFVIRHPGGLLAFDILIDRPIAIDELRIFNGYGKSKALYRKNLRYMDGEFSFFLIDEYGEEADGYGITPGSYYEFPDQYGYRKIDLKGRNPQSKWNKLCLYFPIHFYTNGAVYNDVCISEIQFWHKGKRYEIANLDEVEKIFTYGPWWRRNYWIGEPIQYKKKPWWK